MKPRWERWKERPERRPDGKEKEKPIVPRRIQFLGAFVALLAGMVAVLSYAEAKFDTVSRIIDPPDPPSAQVEVSQLFVGNEEESFSSNSPYGEQSRHSTPQVHMTVTNHASEPLSLRAVRVTIEDSARFPSCIPPQGGGPIPESHYPITLPLPPTPPNYVATYRLRERVVPGEPDYPAFYFGVRRISEEKLLYALKIELVTGEGKRLDVGRVLIAIPGSIKEDGGYLPFDERALEYLAESYAGRGSTRLESTWCFRRALASLRRLTSRPGLRSADLEALAAAEPAPSWDRYADPRPPRAAAEALLGFGGDDATLAAYAASVTGDPDYAAEMRRRAAGALRRTVEAEMRGTFLGLATVDLARESLALVDSPATRALLQRTELRLED